MMLRAVPQPEADLTDLRALHRLELELERKWVEGPYSKWDGELLEKWRYDVRAQISRVEMVLEHRLGEPSVRERFAEALRRELVVDLNAGEIGSPAFERFVRAMDEVVVLPLLQPWP